MNNALKEAMAKVLEGKAGKANISDLFREKLEKKDHVVTLTVSNTKDGVEPQTHKGKMVLCLVQNETVKDGREGTKTDMIFQGQSDPLSLAHLIDALDQARETLVEKLVELTTEGVGFAMISGEDAQELFAALFGLNNKE